MDNTVEQLARLSFNEAHKRLHEMQLPEKLRYQMEKEAIKLRGVYSRASRRSKLMRIQHAEAWHRLIAPLKHELSNARVGLQLKPFDVAPERHDAFTAYVMLLEQVLIKLQQMQETEAKKMDFDKLVLHELSKLDEEELTVQEKALLQDEDNAYTPPLFPYQLTQGRHAGAHWTDWINDRTKEKVEMLFDAIPTKAKRPKPFAYRVPPAMFKRDLEALQKRTLNELEIARQDLSLLESAPTADPDRPDKIEHQRQMVEDMEQALRATLVMRNKPVPHTWHGVKLRTPHPNPKMEALSKDWDEDFADVEQTLRTALGMNDPDKGKTKKTNRPKRYNKL